MQETEVGRGPGWRFSINEDAERDFAQELRETSGVGKRKGRRGKNRSEPVLSQEVRDQMKQAVQTYLAAEYEKAIPLFREIIRIEPGLGEAWNMLASCHAEQPGDDQKALAVQLNIMAAHLNPDAAVWKSLGAQSRDMGNLQQAIYCFRKVISMDPGDVDAMWDRAFLLKQVGDLRGVFNGFLSILRIFPHLPEVLEQLRYLLVELNEIPRIIKIYQDAFDYHRQTQPQPNLETSFGIRQIIALADFYNSINEPEMAIKTIRAGARWLDGRSEERFWDAVSDDREFDVEGYIRQAAEGTENPGQESVRAGVINPLDINMRHRLAIARLKLREFEEGKMHCDIILAHDVLEYHVLFNEIAETYIEQGMYAEALKIFEELAAEQETTSLGVLLNLGTCYRNLTDFNQAVKVYQNIISADPDNDEAKMRLAEVYEMTNKPRKALELVNEVIAARAARAAAKPADTQQEEPEPAQSSSSFFDERRKFATPSKQRKAGSSTLTLKQLQELEAQRRQAVEQGFARLAKLEKDVDAGDEGAIAEWLQEAGNLVEDFRRTKQLFLSNRFALFRGVVAERERRIRSRGLVKSAEKNQDDMASRLELELAEEQARKKHPNKDAKAEVFRGVAFDDWLYLFIKYAFVLTRDGQFELADEVLRHMTISNVYVDFSSQTTLRVALLACAAHKKSYPHVLEHSRKLIGTHQFHNEPLKLMLIALGSGLRSTEAFIDVKLQKNLAREIRLIEWAAQGKECKWHVVNHRYQIPAALLKHSKGAATGGAEEGEGDEEEEEQDEDGAGEGSSNARAPSQAAAGKQKEGTSPGFKATKENPAWLALYGQICAAAKSYQSALYYLIHAYELQPLDPVICLSLAVSYLGRAMQRQSDNRHHMVAEAMAFLTRYRRLRLGTEPGHMDEVEFNFGRAFHQLGLYSYAAKHYGQVLEIVSKRMDASPGSKAAYNLSLIYVTTGATGLAQDLYRRWLSL
ncbi:hypothetical protein BOTBODRAFT_113883 [Botryobasidium botryosum FD-172 SS1]|uniref:TPR-like protein n=1 Tax=Botryobasidium botryosum (strain FD-172 SS1) TaxID=930990 RepID=A0A067MIT5_BOTB1|nr:hypothetical protein BOTBODRAFT_113883 [Botryobasidium botryosum FD-172 SS1]